MPGNFLPPDPGTNPKQSRQMIGRATMRAAKILGSTSLVAFVVFLFRGPWPFFGWPRTVAGALGFDLALSLLFFLQHSGMIRRSFQDRLAKHVPDYYIAAIYAIVSGMTLWAVMLLWQPTDDVWFRLEGPWRWLVRLLFAAALVGFFRASKALGSMDAFGVRPIKVALFGKRERWPSLKIRGLYRRVRHPLYALLIVMIWAAPDWTADRLLFNFTWTLWILLAAKLEERDMVALFGEAYRDYQRQVPMLVPVGRPCQGKPLSD